MSPKGNTLAEYSLPIALLVVVGGALIASNTTELFEGKLASVVKGNVVQKQLNVSQLGQFSLPADTKNLKAPAPDMTQVCFMNPAACLQFPVIDPSKQEAVGSMGEKELMSLVALLENLPELLESLGVDPAVVSQVTDLANKGHALSNSLKEIQTLCPSGETCSGEQMDQAKMALSTLKETDLDAFNGLWQNLQAYLKQNPTALNAFPQAYGIIENQVQDIQALVSSLNFLNKNVVESTKYAGQSTQTMSYNEFSSYVNALPNSTVVKSDGNNWYKTVDPETGSYQLTRLVGTTFVLQKYDYTAASQTASFSVNAQTLDTIHQDANTICQNGGQTLGEGHCLQQVGMDSTFTPL